MFMMLKKGMLPLTAMSVLGFVLPALAQTEERRQPVQPPGQQPGVRTDDLNRAKDMADLIQQGQIKLHEAAEIAERHVKGTALEVSCEIKEGGLEPRELPGRTPKEQPRPGAPGGGDTGSSDEQQPQPGTQAKYTCSMHPDVQMSQPGKCPKCGMELVLKTGDQPGKGELPKPGERETSASKRLVYEVCCFADNKIQAVQVDGITRKVIDVKERKTLARAGGGLP